MTEELLSCFRMNVGRWTSGQKSAYHPELYICGFLVWFLFVNVWEWTLHLKDAIMEVCYELQAMECNFENFVE
jgi:hypothetical protein